MNDIKWKAKERGQKMKLPYAGALLPTAAHEFMRKGAKLVDVRTDAELHYVGSVPGSEAIEWNSIDGQRNPGFLRQLEQVANKDEPVMFLCRSGARSHAAATAAAQAGWKEAYNVLEGFEGDKDSQEHRGTVGGWRHARLPWVQS